MGFIFGCVPQALVLLLDCHEVSFHREDESLIQVDVLEGAFLVNGRQQGTRIGVWKPKCLVPSVGMVFFNFDLSGEANCGRYSFLRFE